MTFGQGGTGERETIQETLGSKNIDLARLKKREAPFSTAKRLHAAGLQPLS